MKLLIVFALLCALVAAEEEHVVVLNAENFDTIVKQGGCLYCVKECELEWQGILLLNFMLLGVATVRNWHRNMKRRQSC